MPFWRWQWERGKKQTCVRVEETLWWIVIYAPRQLQQAGSLAWAFPPISSPQKKLHLVDLRLHSPYTIWRGLTSTSLHHPSPHPMPIHPNPSATTRYREAVSLHSRSPFFGFFLFCTCASLAARFSSVLRRGPFILVSAWNTDPSRATGLGHCPPFMPLPAATLRTSWKRIIMRRNLPWRLYGSGSRPLREKIKRDDRKKGGKGSKMMVVVKVRFATLICLLKAKLAYLLKAILLPFRV